MLQGLNGSYMEEYQIYVTWLQGAVKIVYYLIH